jgi:hypothetical protein
MKQRMGRFAGLAGATTLVVSCMGFGGGAASATPVGAVPFGQANFNGYATGDLLHLGVTALDNLSGATGVSLNSLDQGVSSASTSTAGLTTPITSELKTVVQPAQAAGVHAFNEGAGLELNLGSLGSLADTLNSVVKQIPLPTISIAPPNTAAGKNQLLSLPLDPILDASVLTGEAQAAWPGDACPTGNLSYGLGGLATANVLTGLPTLTSALGSGAANTAPLISTTAPGGTNGLAQSKSITTMVPNGDGSYGIQTQASDVIAPISINLLGLATLNIGVQTADSKLDPVMLTSTTSGESSKPASTVLSTDDLVVVKLTTLSTTGQPTTLLDESIPLTAANNGRTIDLSLNGASNLLSQLTLPNLVQFLENALNTLPQGSTLSSTLNSVLGQLNPVLSPVETALNTAMPTVQQLISQLNSLITLNLGSIKIGTVPHAIGAPDSPVTAVGGTQTGGALTLLDITLGLTDSSINIPSQVVKGVNIPLTKINLPEIPLANPVIGHIESASALNAPIACTTAAVNQQVSPTTAPPTPTTAPKLPFTGGPGGLWQPLAGVAFLGVGGGALALVRRLRRHTAA